MIQRIFVTLAFSVMSFFPLALLNPVHAGIVEIDLKFDEVDKTLATLGFGAILIAGILGLVLLILLYFKRKRMTAGIIGFVAVVLAGLGVFGVIKSYDEVAFNESEKEKVVSDTEEDKNKSVDNDDRDDTGKNKSDGNARDTDTNENDTKTTSTTYTNTTYDFLFEAGDYYEGIIVTEDDDTDGWATAALNFCYPTTEESFWNDFCPESHAILFSIIVYNEAQFQTLVESEVFGLNGEEIIGHNSSEDLYYVMAFPGDIPQELYDTASAFYETMYYSFEPSGDAEELNELYIPSEGDLGGGSLNNEAYLACNTYCSMFESEDEACYAECENPQFVEEFYNSLSPEDLEVLFGEN